MLVKTCQQYISDGLCYGLLQSRLFTLADRCRPGSTCLEAEIVCRTTVKSHKRITGRMTELSTEFVLYGLGCGQTVEMPFALLIAKLLQGVSVKAVNKPRLSRPAEAGLRRLCFCYPAFRCHPNTRNKPARVWGPVRSMPGYFQRVPAGLFCILDQKCFYSAAGCSPPKSRGVQISLDNTLIVVL